MADVDFQAMLDSFGRGSGSDDPIRAIYHIIPRYDNYQLKVLFVLRYFVAKWQLEDVNELLKHMDDLMAQNRNLGFLGSQNLKALLSAYTQNELMRGVKVNTFNNTSTNDNTSS